MQQFVDIKGSTEGPARFGIAVDDTAYKLFNYFLASPLDDSFAIHSYIDSSHSLTKRVPQESPIEGRIVTSDEYEDGAIEFVVHKATVHPSGVMTMKDKYGDRASEEPDFRSIKFRDIKNSVKICHMYPMKLTEYPEIDWNEGKSYNYVKLSKGEGRVPIRVEIMPRK